jgi:HAE1 family hydrophobic/amphiphilic exporter-1
VSFLTGLALRRRSVTILLIAMVLGGGVLTYRSLPVELLPEIEFPLVTVSTFYPSANPDAVVRDVTVPIENAISGITGLDLVQSTSSENRSLILANFTFGTDMGEAERTLASHLSSIVFPVGVTDPQVGRIDSESFPVIQLSVLSDRDILDTQRVVERMVLPAIVGLDGVFNVEITGNVQQQILVEVNTDRLSELGISLSQVGRALRDNSFTLPAGSITQGGQTFSVRTTNAYTSLENLRGLVVGFSPGSGGVPSGEQVDETGVPQPVLLSDLAEVSLGTNTGASVSRTNGSASLGLAVIKEPKANTVDVTRAVLESLLTLEALPSDVQIVTITNDGPEIKAQVDTLQQEAILGFFFAITVVFAFLITRRPTIMQGIRLTIRPTLVIGLSIPLSILTGILLMGTQAMTLNLMTLGGLAISVGRVVDDSIVVLENVYRHIQRGEDRFQAALEATREVAPAVTASTLTTIAVFVPLAFIQGLVGSFFLPFALTVSFALVASLLVALTFVPVLGALLLRPGDLRAGATANAGNATDGNTWMQRLYEPVLLWALRYKAATLLTAFMLTVGSLGFIVLIPITLFSSGGERFLSIEMSLPSGTAVDGIFTEVNQIEGVLSRLVDEGIVEIYQTTVGGEFSPFGPGAGSGSLSSAIILVRLAEDAPAETVENLRVEMSVNGRKIAITQIGEGPPQSGLDVSVTGSDYGLISGVAEHLAADFSAIDGIINVRSDVSEAKDEIVVTVKPSEAAAVGLTAADVAAQVSQLLVGQAVTQVNLDGTPLSVILRGRPADVDSIEKVRAMIVAGPSGSTSLGQVADVAFEKGPVSISRSAGRRSASITGAITAEDTQAISRKVQSRIDAVELPPGVKVSSGGIFQQIAEGFQDLALAMVVGVLLVYLVMVASLGSLRNPFVIIMSLPLALIGALAALAITGRTLGLPAAMGLLLLIGIVVTNAIVLIAFVEQLRQRGMGIHEALVEGGRVRLRPILMTAFTTSFALVPMAAFVSNDGGIIGADLATVVIGGLISSTFLTLIVVPVVYTVMHVNIPRFLHSVGSRSRRAAPVALTTGKE